VYADGRGIKPYLAPLGSPAIGHNLTRGRSDEPPVGSGMAMPSLPPRPCSTIGLPVAPASTRGRAPRGQWTLVRAWRDRWLCAGLAPDPEARSRASGGRRPADRGPTPPARPSRSRLSVATRGGTAC